MLPAGNHPLPSSSYSPPPSSSSLDPAPEPSSPIPTMPVLGEGPSPLRERAPWMNRCVVLGAVLSTMMITLGAGVTWGETRFKHASIPLKSLDSTIPLGPCLISLGMVGLASFYLANKKRNQNSSVESLPLDSSQMDSLISVRLEEAKVRREVEGCLNDCGPPINNEANRTFLENRIRLMKQRDPNVPLASQLGQFSDNMIRVQERLERDYVRISEKFFDGQELELERIEVCQGETHHGGQIACILSFKNSPKKIVYKPRDIRTDALICSKRVTGATGGESSSSSQTLQPESLFGIISRYLSTEMPTYQFLPMEDESGQYGYVEYLSHGTSEDCHLGSQGEVEAYYKMIGRYQALAQIFGIYDLHQENLLTHLRLPFLIDLETSFDPIHLRGDTGLDMAITVFRNQENLSTPNQISFQPSHVQSAPSLFDALKETPSTLGIPSEEAKEFILEALASGYEEIRECLTANEQLRQELEEFTRRLPEDVTVRFVPMPTWYLLSWLNSPIRMPNHPESLDSKELVKRELKLRPRLDVSHLAGRLLFQAYFLHRLGEEQNDMNLISDIDQANFPDVQEVIRELINDFSNGDVPVMHMRVWDSSVTYNTIRLGAIYSQEGGGHPLVDRIFANIIEPPPMSELFIKQVKSGLNIASTH